LRAWLISLAGVIATVALVAGNLEKILEFGSKWISPRLAAQTEMTVALDPGEQRWVVHVYVAEPDAKPRKIMAVADATANQPARLRVPAGMTYDIGWQGAGIRAGAASGMLAVKGSSFHLVHTSDVEGQIEFQLRWTEADKPAPVVVEPHADLLVSARATQVAADPSIFVASTALPELDRATMIIGMFETGTTECARQVFYMPVYGSAGRVTPIVGCLSFSMEPQSGGALASVIGTLDGGDAHRLDAWLGGDAAALRRYVQDSQAIPEAAQMRRTIDKLVGLPEFWIAYQRRVLGYYAEATELAGKAGLVSERGRLLFLDRLINVGPGALRRAMQSYAEKWPEGAPGRPATEPERIRALGEIFKAQVPPLPFKAMIVSRIDTIVTGHGSIRSISFDLNQLGVSDAG
jgi:hypothetical protein